MLTVNKCKKTDGLGIPPNVFLFLSGHCFSVEHTGTPCNDRDHIVRGGTDLSPVAEESITK